MYIKRLTKDLPLELRAKLRRRPLRPGTDGAAVHGGRGRPVRHRGTGIGHHAVGVAGARRRAARDHPGSGVAAWPAKRTNRKRGTAAAHAPRAAPSRPCARAGATRKAARCPNASRPGPTPARRARRRASSRSRRRRQNRASTPPRRMAEPSHGTWRVGKHSRDTARYEAVRLAAASGGAAGDARGTARVAGAADHRVRRPGRGDRQPCRAGAWAE